MHWADAFMGAGGLGTVTIAVAALFKGRFGTAIRRVAAEVLALGLKDLDANISKRFDDNDQATQAVEKSVQEMDAKVVKLNAAVYPNGGSSLADKVNTISIDLAELKGSFGTYVQEHKQ